jgi:hypothetical protein
MYLFVKFKSRHFLPVLEITIAESQHPLLPACVPQRAVVTGNFAGVRVAGLPMWNVCLQFCSEIYIRTYIYTPHMAEMTCAYGLKIEERSSKIRSVHLK